MIGLKNELLGDFPGGPVVKTSPFNAEGAEPDRGAAGGNPGIPELGPRSPGGLCGDAAPVGVFSQGTTRISGASRPWGLRIRLPVQET